MPNPPADALRLSRVVAERTGCSRAQAEQYIEGGWVSVDGEVVEEPQFAVTGQTVEIDPHAVLEAAEPATILLNKPEGFDFGDGPNPAAALLVPDHHAAGDASGVRPLKRHFAHLTPLVPLDTMASGLMVFSQDGRVRRRLSEDFATIEQEFNVEVRGETGPYTLSRLSRGLSYRGRVLPPCKVSWQNEVTLRFAIKAVALGQLQDMCTQVGLEALSIRRLRIGRVGLSKMPVGQWRYLPVTERF